MTTSEKRQARRAQELTDARKRYAETLEREIVGKSRDDDDATRTQAMQAIGITDESGDLAALQEAKQLTASMPAEKSIDAMRKTLEEDAPAAEADLRKASREILDAVPVTHLIAAMQRLAVSAEGNHSPRIEAAAHDYVRRTAFAQASIDNANRQRADAIARIDELRRQNPLAFGLEPVAVTAEPEPAEVRVQYVQQGGTSMRMVG